MIDLTEGDMKSVEDHITTKTNVSVWVSRNSSTKGDSFMTGPCHAQAWRPLMDTKKYLYFASNADYPPPFKASYYNEGQQKTINHYLEWLFGPTSPFRKVFADDMKVITKDDRICGFILGDVAANPESGNRGAIMNLCVAARFMRDWTHYFKQMSSLHMDLGLPIEKAFILCPYFAKEGTRWVRSRYVWDAGHNPLRESQQGEIGYFSGSGMGAHCTYILDIAALKNGDYNYKLGSVQQSSAGWLKLNSQHEYPLSDRCNMAMGQIKSKFSSLGALTDENILNLAKEIDL